MPDRQILLAAQPALRLHLVCLTNSRAAVVPMLYCLGLPCCMLITSRALMSLAYAMRSDPEPNFKALKLVPRRRMLRMWWS